LDDLAKFWCLQTTIIHLVENYSTKEKTKKEAA